MKRVLWTLNGLLAAAILAFGARYLAFPPRIDHLAGIDPDAALPSPPPKPGDRPNEEALFTLRNPLHPGNTTGRDLTRPVVTLHGALPTLSGGQGVAFIKAGRVDLVVPIGERIEGWRLVDLWKDRAILQSDRGERMDLVIDSAIRR